MSLGIRPGETLGLVGESGSGKTTIGRAVLGLAPVESGTITFAGSRIERAGRARRRALARDLRSCSGPVHLAQPLPYGRRHPRRAPARPGHRDQGGTGPDRGTAGAGTPARRRRRPAALEFSGGQRQRVAIARALALRPRLVICDEPVSALDLTTQRTVLELLLEIQEETRVAYLFVTHDLGSSGS